MRMSMGLVALLVLVLGAGAPPLVAGMTTGDTGNQSEAQQRVQERRRQRQGQRRWISVPEMSVADVLPLVEAPGVAIIDVTCRERGANYSERIPGAVWQDCTKVEQWAHQYEEVKTILVYCA